MTFTQTVLTILATGAVAGWLVTEAALLAPVRSRITARANQIRNIELRHWLLDGLECPACTGFYPQAAMTFAVYGWPLPLEGLAALLIGFLGHLAWLNLVGLITAARHWLLSN